MADKALQALADRYPSLSADLEQFAQLHDRKLWHQLTNKIEEALAKPEFHQDDLIIQLYKTFVASFAHKINLLRLAHIAVTVAKEFSEATEAVAFLQDVVAKLIDAKLPRTEQPVLLLQTQIAQYQLQLGQLQETKQVVEDSKATLDALQDVDPAVSAAVHYLRSLYFKSERNFAEFYKSSLLYLAFVSSDDLDPEFKLSLAVDISLAALLGDNVYNFGELLLHPIITVLDSSPYAWLHDMLECFNRGDLHKYDELCIKYADVLNDQPALAANERKLREKITILCLMELIFSLPAEERTIPLQTIAQRTKLSVDGVEFLLMKTLSLHLIAGIIDEVAGSVQVSWVQPGVLTKPQISSLKDRLDGWISKVSSAALGLEDQSVGILAE